MKSIPQIRQSFDEALAGAETSQQLEQLRVQYLGRNGEVTRVLRSLGELPLERKRELGPQAQALKDELEQKLTTRAAELAASARPFDIDLTAPGRRASRGHLHPLTIAESEIRRIFAGMNFSTVSGPEVESEYFNFDALNFPPGHPARETQDTFWIKQPPATKKNSKTNLLLRTQVSAVQIHHLLSHEPPFQIIYPGRTFRYEASDAGHESNFYQVEGMVVGKDIALANFKYVIEEFLHAFLGSKIEFRYRPSFFPFTEPSVEVDVKFNGKWFEIMGAGMVNQKIFEYAHYNPGDWQGFAFGMGLDRLTMIKYGVPDIRLFYSGDLRFIRQF